MSDNATQEHEGLGGEPPPSLPAVIPKRRKRGKPVKAAEFADMLQVEVATNEKDEMGRTIRERLLIPSSPDDNRNHAKIVVAKLEALLDEIQEIWLAEAKAGMGKDPRGNRSPRLQELQTIIKMRSDIMEMGKYAHGDKDNPKVLKADNSTHGALSGLSGKVVSMGKNITSITTKVDFDDLMANIQEAEVVAADGVSRIVGQGNG
jgi:hypothetical protein